MQKIGDFDSVMAHSERLHWSRHGCRPADCLICERALHRAIAIKMGIIKIERKPRGKKAA